MQPIEYLRFLEIHLPMATLFSLKSDSCLGLYLISVTNHHHHHYLESVIGELEVTAAY